MAETQTVHMMLFPEDRLDEASEALARLRESGYGHDDISVISGVPISDRVLGRPMTWTHIGKFGIAGAILGFIVAAIFNFGTPLLYGLRVGGQPIFALPTSIVVFFELTMLGLLLSTFLGVVVEMITPSHEPKGYHPDVTGGKIAILFNGEKRLDGQLEQSLKDLGAEFEEARKL
jgi:hypothetical protein